MRREVLLLPKHPENGLVWRCIRAALDKSEHPFGKAGRKLHLEAQACGSRLRHQCGSTFDVFGSLCSGLRQSLAEALFSGCGVMSEKYWNELNCWQNGNSANELFSAFLTLPDIFPERPVDAGLIALVRKGIPPEPVNYVGVKP
jgi:hypothetical protein